MPLPVSMEVAPLSRTGLRVGARGARPLPARGARAGIRRIAVDDRVGLVVAGDQLELVSQSSSGRDS